MLSTGVNWDAILQDVDPRRNGGRVFDNRPRDDEEDLQVGREGAMGNLNGRQLSALENLQLRALIRRADRHYSREDSLRDLENYLRTKYLENPVRYRHGTVVGFDPLHLQGISEAKRKELQQNPYHTAYRYLFMRPNPLGNPEASYAVKVFRDQLGTLYRTPYNLSNPNCPYKNYPYVFVGTEASISESEWNDIDNIWNAIKDQDIPLAEGYNQDAAKERFAGTLADLGRAHNWDHTRQVQKMVNRNGRQQLAMVTEEYDDETPDNCSCSMGVKRRLTQIVMMVLQDTPDTRPLDPGTMQVRFNGEVITSRPDGDSVFNVVDRMTLAQLKDAKSAIDKKFVYYDDELTPAETAAFAQLEWWNTRDVQAFIAGAKEFYGIPRIKDALSVKPRHFGNQAFDNYGMLIVKLFKDAIQNNYDAINGRVENRIAELELAERLERERQERERLERERQERERFEAQRLEQARQEEQRQRELLARQRAQEHDMAEITRRVQAELMLAQQVTAAPATSGPSKPVVTGFDLHRQGPRVTLDKGLTEIFNSPVARDFLSHISRFPLAAKVLNMYSKEVSQKLAEGLNKNGAFFQRLSQFSARDLVDFLLQFAFKQKQVLLLAEQGELFKAIVMSNEQASIGLDRLTFEQVRKLDAKLSEPFMERFMSFKPEQQAQFFTVWQQKNQPQEQKKAAKLN